MITNASDLPPDLPPSERSAYEYSVGCSFKSLHPPDIEVLINLLHKHKDYTGSSDRIELLSVDGKELLGSTHFWDPFTKKLVIASKYQLQATKIN